MDIPLSNILSGFFLASVLVACSSGGNGNSSCTIVTLDMVGTWLSSCIDNLDGTYHVTTLDITSTDIAVSTQNYSDATCMTTTGGVESPITGTYTVGCAIMDSQGMPAAQLDLVATSTGFTYFEIAYIDGMGQLFVSGDANTTAYPTTLDLTTPYTR